MSSSDRRALRGSPPTSLEAATVIAQRELRDSGYASLRRIECRPQAGAVILRGRVASYYLKQLAQEAVRKADRTCAIINDVEVD